MRRGAKGRWYARAVDPATTDEGTTGAYGGSRVVPEHLTAPPPLAHDGRGLAATLPERREPEPQDLEIAEAIAEEAQPMEELLARLIDTPTVLGQEAAGQNIMRAAFRELGLDTVDVSMDAEALRSHPGHSPFDWDVSRKTNVVATWGEPNGGCSLVLNGHVDVVSPEPVGEWNTPPFTATRKDDWIVGRGAADMKCGLASIIGAARGLRSLGLSPQAPLHLQSVVEEECTGNATLACVQAGYTADAAIITEPFGAAITTSQVGVLWFQVRIKGVPAHAADMSVGINAIEKSLEVTRALRRLEEELNAAPPPPYDAFDHPINLNVGVIRGGDWPSTVPGECVTSYRIALYPNTRVRVLQDRIEAIVAEAAVADPAIFSHPPEVRYGGFACEGYELPHDAPLVSTLAYAFARGSGGPPALVATTGTTDARIFGLYGNTPAVCFGPYAEKAHGADERVYFPSVVETAQVLGLFIKDWCGLAS